MVAAAAAAAAALLAVPVGSTRCYTDVAASKANSTECGHGTGCIKVYVDSEEYLMRMHRGYGYGQEPGRLPELPPRLRGDPVVLRGCFALQVNHNRCYLARDGYSYCWCDKDLCNGGGHVRRGRRHLATLLSVVLVAAACRNWFGGGS